MSEARSPLLLYVCAGVGVLGCVAAVGGNLIGGALVPGHSWVADTISNLAAGKYEAAQDVALYGYAAAFLALAIGAAHHHTGGARWSAGIFCLTLLALVVVMIGARNEYGDSDNDGYVFHRQLVYALGALFFAAPLLMADGMGRDVAALKTLSVVCAILWAVGAVAFFFLPTSIDGLWERGLGLLTMVWIVALSAVLFRAARAARG